MKKQILIGFITGIISAIIGILLFDIIIGLYNGDAIMDILERSRSARFLGKRVSIGALINLPVFYFFLNKKKEYHARGVLIATMIIAVIFIVNKF
ncbi:hypothetical protein [Winogradskyella immobilis]|uniref:DUF3784 domain-containing protein n=1 Tax=Winogradskyella immobilis TaxID=2816852 RepID=A0ABS8EJ02_9FLAO|nr:hypothetical protein [Winogradskyella immobilis]MCC1483189.1 hypothetical protein [Winogradskyella immobilis]MCG0015284.1 hypothetical protein [Winogradskyella immobilis]